MKMYKKVMAAALAGVMTVSMSATAFAADDDGYILKTTNEVCTYFPWYYPVHDR
jgi:glutathione transport system substrate-binding protein